MADCHKVRRCKGCRVGRLRLQPSVPFVDTDYPITLEHVEENPRTFQNKRELRAYAKEKKYELGALL